MISTKKPTTQTKKTTLTTMRIPLPQKATPTPIRTSTRLNSTRLDSTQLDSTTTTMMLPRQKRTTPPQRQSCPKPYNQTLQQTILQTTKSNTSNQSWNV